MIPRKEQMVFGSLHRKNMHKNRLFENLLHF